MILLSAQVSITHTKLSNDAFLFWFQMILTGKIVLSILTCEKVKCHKKEDMLWIRYSFSHINHAWLLYEENKLCFVNTSTKILKYHADVWEGRSATIWWYRDGYNHDKKRNSNPILFILSLLHVWCFFIIEFSSSWCENCLSCLNFPSVLIITSGSFVWKSLEWMWNGGITVCL
jgi:hypothetical protein